ncbi:DUF2516 family protein [Mycolicibacillus koreensis]|uniref:DUF2516 family protein n=1 Tax=Mycolicibacillus koreensis TaxID=1069220 RepID=UPI00138BC52B|nr:hypothetical protein MKOR_25460 [Mycolicibacillus koreensis]
MIFANAVNLVLLALQIGVFGAALYGLVHAALQRPDAYTATDKLTKPVWLVILGASVLLSALPQFILGWVIAACAVGVYLVDVRPRLLEVQGKSR